MSPSSMEVRLRQAVASAKSELRHCRDELHNVLVSSSQQQHALPAAAIVLGAGVLTFGSVTAASCWLQLVVAGISTGTRAPIPTVTGMATVCVASLASHCVAMHTVNYYYLRTGKLLPLPQMILSTSTSSSRHNQHHHDDQWRTRRDYNYSSDSWTVGPVQIPMHTIRICAVGLIAFKLLGGRFWALAPSSYTHPGSFARCSIPATERYATSSQRVVVERLGRTWGCHTCGSRQFLYNTANKASASRMHRFVGDHMPPKSVADQMNARWYRKLLLPGCTVQFRFYPQCVPCSNKQGGILSTAVQELMKLRRSTSSRQLLHRWGLLKTGGGPSLSAAGGLSSTAHFHGLRPRLHMLSGGVLAGMVVVAAAADGSSGSSDPQQQLRRYYANLQTDAEQWLRRQHSKVVALQQQQQQQLVPWLKQWLPRWS